MKSPSPQKLTAPQSVATALSSVMAHTLWSVILAESDKSISYVLLCLSLNFLNETSEPELHEVLKPGAVGFVQAQVLEERS